MKLTKKLILDTSELLNWWHERRSEFGGILTPAVAEDWARQLIQKHDTNAIVTPVYLEVMAGTRSKKEHELMRAYLRPFVCVDEQKIIPRDWQEALRLAQRVPRNQRPRDLGDCLIRAIANRLNCNVFTRDKDFPR
jgi:predicted nucleic acid-binding protein